MAPKLSQQVIPLGGIGALQTAEVAQIMAFPHEFRRRELHRRPRRRGETRCYLRKAGHEADRRDHKSEADRGADRLAERADVDDRSEQCRVGKERVRAGRSRWARYHENKNKKKT